MAQPNKPPKTMSSRLLTMKFMQRAAGTTSSPPSSPATPAAPSSKRQRLSDGSYRSSPTSFSPSSDAGVAGGASATDEARRIESPHERDSLGRGDAEWYLSFHEPSARLTESPLRVVSAGFSTLDRAPAADDEVGEDGLAASPVRPVVNGRRSFGKFNRAIEKQQRHGDAGAANDSSSSSSDDDEDDADEQDEDESDDPTGAKAMISQARKEAAAKARIERRAKKKADKAESERLAAERRQRTVNLNTLTSVSGGRGLSGGRATPNGSPSAKDIVCYKCNRKGHTKQNCPSHSGRRQY